MENKTWKLTPIPEERVIIQNKWVFNKKLGYKGTPPCFKAIGGQRVYTRIWRRPWRNLRPCSKTLHPKKLYLVL
jgi:hypothetical protein